jgi:hypothetical protein
MALRRIGVVLGVIVLAICLVLLLNVTAPNPTHPRYSSQIPRTDTRQYTSNEIGLDGEEILAADLHLPRNQAAEQLHCICNPTFAENRSELCRTCFAISEHVGNYRIPDFVGPTLMAPAFIADSKNVAQLSQTYRDFDQIRDYAAVARELRIPLWLFVRVNSSIDPQYVTLVQETGGGVVYYFTVPGYVDPVDVLAAFGAGVSGLFLLGVGVSARAAKHQWRLPRLPRPGRPFSGQPSDGKAKRAAAATENLDWFKERSKSRARYIIDVEDSRDEEP